MKIIKGFLFTIIIFLLLSFVLADQDEKNVPSLPDLIKKEKSTVNKHDAYQFYVSWSDGKPCSAFEGCMVRCKVP